MAKIRTAMPWLLVGCAAMLAFNIWLLIENTSKRRALAYACGFTNGQRNIMDAMPHAFRPKDNLPEITACAPDRDNAQRHGFKQRGTQ